MTRLLCFGPLLAMFPLPGLARPKLGNDEWMLRFRAFVKLFNAFVESLNDGCFDLSTWQRMRAAWTKLEME